MSYKSKIFKFNDSDECTVNFSHYLYHLLGKFRYYVECINPAAKTVIKLHKQYIFCCDGLTMLVKLHLF